MLWELYSIASTRERAEGGFLCCFAVFCQEGAPGDCQQLSDVSSPSYAAVVASLYAVTDTDRNMHRCCGDCCVAVAAGGLEEDPPVFHDTSTLG